ncbi:hypothetical protein D7Z26_05900 [Cohnella endophytica]|uniref:DUF559 domain-containing protein n=1 Tax=Cohnella endophytica TaxID=2419778 RepID=A0A494Y0A9_9BACL|nr:hypothetical protein [Cohnella endophytica]RKP56174.1 hypothetical protein D7Z26_05900 [Cohnella endophytica]
MEFEAVYASFMQSHVQRRSGERRGRLLSRDFHGEKLFLRKVWMPLMGNLDGLHPEYEISDWRGRPYYADYAWQSPWGITVLFEIKGFGKHVRDMDRNGYCNELNREVFLQAMGYRVVCLAYDDVADRPEVCLTLLRLYFSQFHTANAPMSTNLLGEKEVLKFALRQAIAIRPIDVTRHLQVDYRTAKRLLDQLVVKGWLKPIRAGAGVGERIVRYEAVKDAIKYLC